MAIRVGTKISPRIYVGSKSIAKIYVGEREVYPGNKLIIPPGTLYLLASSTLYTVAIPSGQLTSIGRLVETNDSPFTINGARGLTTIGDTMYMCNAPINFGWGLYTVNTSTGACTRVGTDNDPNPPFGTGGLSPTGLSLIHI